MSAVRWPTVVQSVIASHLIVQFKVLIRTMSSITDLCHVTMCASYQASHIPLVDPLLEIIGQPSPSIRTMFD